MRELHERIKGGQDVGYYFVRRTEAIFSDEFPNLIRSRKASGWK